MIHRFKWFLVVLASLLVVVTGQFLAQEMDEDGLVVEEDLMMDEALEGDVLSDDELLGEELLDDSIVDDLDAALGEEPDLGDLDVEDVAVDLDDVPVEEIKGVPDAGFAEMDEEPAMEAVDEPLDDMMMDDEPVGDMMADVEPDSGEGDIMAVEADAGIEPMPDMGMDEDTEAMQKAVAEALEEAIAAGVPGLGSMDPNTALLADVADEEELRRKALEAHGYESLRVGQQAFSEKDYVRAIASFEDARKYLRRRETEAARALARKGLAESYYFRALALEKQGDIEEALKVAVHAEGNGHSKGNKLVSRLRYLRDHPPVEQPPKVPPRWGEDTYKEHQKQIADFLKKGREYYLTGEYNEARIQLESVMKRDPHNTEAIRLLEKLGQKKYDIATMELEATRRNMMGDLRRTWNPRDYALTEAPAVAVTGAPKPSEDIDRKLRQLILGKMERIVIPEIDFRIANIHDVIEFLQDASVEFDTSTDPDERKGVNIILNLQQGGGGGGGAAQAAPADDFMDFGFGDEMQPEASADVTSDSDITPITFKARYISLLEALRIVTDVAGLKFRVEGSVVMVVPLNAPDGRIIHIMYDVLPSLPEKIADVSASLASDLDDFGTLGGDISIDRGQSTTDEWKQFFEEMGVKWPTGSSIKHLPAIGKLMVANTAENLTIFEKILGELNVVPNQIEIETRFVEIAQFDSASLGFEWLLSDDWEMFQKKGQDGIALSGRERIVMGANAQTPLGMPAGGFTRGLRFLEADMAEEPIADDILSIASVLTNPELQFVLHMLEQTGHADLLSAPKVTTQSGEEATIKVVTEYIYPTEFEVTPIVIAFEGAAIPVGGIVEPGSFETREVGVILSVLPDVSPEGSMINLTMTPEVVSEPIWKDYGVSFTDPDGNTISLPMEQPFFHTRMVSTTVSIYNGATIAMGGMINEWREDADDKIPFFGNIPFIGRLFSSKFEKSEKRNLLIFVTARLVDPMGRPAGVGQAIPVKIGSTKLPTEE